MRFCSELVLRTAVLTALAGMVAKAETTPQDAAAPRVVSVVRSDARTGRLVRSIVVNPVKSDGTAGIMTIPMEDA